MEQSEWRSLSVSAETETPITDLHVKLKSFFTPAVLQETLETKSLESH